MKLFIANIKVSDPDVIVRGTHRGKPDYSREGIKGSFRLVFPHDANEVMAVRMLDMHVDRFAPATGEGLLISERAFQQFQQSQPITANLTQ